MRVQSFLLHVLLLLILSSVSIACLEGLPLQPLEDKAALSAETNTVPISEASDTIIMTPTVMAETVIMVTTVVTVNETAAVVESSTLTPTVDSAEIPLDPTATLVIVEHTALATTAIITPTTDAVENETVEATAATVLTPTTDSPTVTLTPTETETTDLPTTEPTLPLAHTQLREILIAEPLNIHPTLGDFDNDGDLDVAFLKQEDRESETSPVFLNIYHNDAATFELKQTIPLTASHRFHCTCLDITLVDFDMDGFLDLTVTTSGGVVLLMNEQGVISHKPVWQSPVHGELAGVTWGDYDRDGDDDLAISLPERLVVYENLGGELNMDPVWESVDGVKKPVQWADVNNDGLLDLLTTTPAALYLNQDEDAASSVLATESVWSWSPPVVDQGFGEIKAEHVDLIAEDFDGNGLLDFALFTRETGGFFLAFSTLESKIAIFNNTDGVPAMMPSKQFRAGSAFLSDGELHSADMDSDGDFDLILDRGFSIFYNQNGEINSTRHFIDQSEGIALGDVDNNGLIDAVGGEGPQNPSE